MLGSKNTFFKQEKMVLSERREYFEKYLDLLGKPERLKHLYLDAYDDAVDGKYKFDGATASQDLYPKKLGFDHRALLHDYLWIMLDANASYKAIPISNYIYLKEMKNDGVSGFYIAWQRFRLSVVSKPFVLLTRLKGKRPKPENIERVLELKYY